MQQTLHNILDGDGKQVATIVTQVLVSPQDPDFQDPTKPVGPFYAEEIAKKLAAERGWVVKKVRPTGDKTWRRVVPSPAPLGIAEIPESRTDDLEIHVVHREERPETRQQQALRQVAVRPEDEQCRRSGHEVSLHLRWLRRQAGAHAPTLGPIMQVRRLRSTGLTAVSTVVIVGR
jgi:hypothetical protein